MRCTFNVIIIEHLIYIKRCKVTADSRAVTQRRHIKNKKLKIAFLQDSGPWIRIAETLTLVTSFWVGTYCTYDTVQYTKIASILISFILLISIRTWCRMRYLNSPRYCSRQLDVQLGEELSCLLLICNPPSILAFL